MAQEQIKGGTGDLGSDGSLTTYVVPGSAVITPYTVSVTFDGTGAGGSFLPCLTFKTITGAVIARCPAPGVAAGGTAEVSWFPHVGGGNSGGTQTLVGARVIATSTQTVPTATNTNLVYQTVDFDTDGMTNLGTDPRILTVNTPGLYIVTCNTQWVYNNAGRRLNGILQNAYYSAGGLFLASDGQMAVWAPVGGSGGGSPHTANTSIALLQANAGDFFSSGCFQQSGGNLDCGGTSAAEKNDSALAAILIAG